MKKADFRRFVDGHRWKFAKSMPKIPHWYVVRKTCRDDEEFVLAMRAIGEFGYDDNFFKVRVRYIDLDGHRFWTLGYTYESTYILNRAENNHPDIPWAKNPLPWVHKPWKVAAEPAGQGVEGTHWILN